MRDGSLSGCQDIEWNWATGPGWLHLAVGLVLEGGDLLDGDLLLVETVPGLDHGAVRALAQELGRLVAGSDLQGTLLLIAIHRTNPRNKVSVLSRLDRRMETFNKIRSEFSAVTVI